MVDKAKLMKAIQIGVVKAMFDMERMAKKLCPVDTGLLRSSIKTELTSEEIVLSANANYASYVEYGTIKRRPQPFIRPALHFAIRKFIPDRIRQEVAKI